MLYKQTQLGPRCSPARPPAGNKDSSTTNHTNHTNPSSWFLLFHSCDSCHSWFLCPYLVQTCIMAAVLSGDDFQLLRVGNADHQAAAAVWLVSWDAGRSRWRAGDARPAKRPSRTSCTVRWDRVSCAGLGGRP